MPEIFQVEKCKINDADGFIVRSANPSRQLLVTTDESKVMDYICSR